MLASDETAILERYHSSRQHLDPEIRSRPVSEADKLAATCLECQARLQSRLDIFRDLVSARVQGVEREQSAVTAGWAPTGWSFHAKNVSRLLGVIAESAQAGQLTFESPQVVSLSEKSYPVSVLEVDLDIFTNGDQTLHALASSGALREATQAFEQAGVPLNRLDVGWFYPSSGHRSFVFEGPEIAELASCYPEQVASGRSPRDAVYDIRWSQDIRQIPVAPNRADIYAFLIDPNTSDADKLAQLKALGDLHRSGQLVIPVAEPGQSQAPERPERLAASPLADTRRNPLPDSADFRIQ